LTSHGAAEEGPLSLSCLTPYLACSVECRCAKTYKERYRLNIFAEMFNSFNIANLRGYSASLDAKNANPSAQVYAFGQPTQRVVQTFGSGGPRAVQLGARVSF
jgi:hypothetical protein